MSKTYTSGKEESGAVGCGVVSQTNLDAILGQLVAVGSSQHTVSLQPGVGNLAADVLVRNADNHAVLGGVVLVFGLHDEALAGIVVGLTLTTPTELDLESLEVSLALYYFNERLKK